MTLNGYQIMVIIVVVIAFAWIIVSLIRGDDDVVPTDAHTDWWEAGNENIPPEDR